MPGAASSLLSTLAIGAAGAAAGGFAARPPAASLLVDHPRGLAGPWQARGWLLTDPHGIAPNTTMDLQVEQLSVDGAWKPWPLRVRTTVYEPAGVGWSAGDGFEAFLALRTDRPAANPLVPRRSPLRAAGADVRASLKSFRQLRRRPQLDRWSLRAALAPARGALRAASTTLFGADDAFVRALLLGERGDLPTPLEERFARTGLVHLLAISGLHVGLVTGALFLALAAAGLPRPRAAILCIVALPLIDALVLPRPAVLRASLMAAFVLGGLASGRRTAALNGLAAASILLAMADPWVTRDLGFQLSTAATAAILLGAAPGPRPSEGRSRCRAAAASTLVAGLEVSCAAQLGVAPILAAATFRLPWIAPLLNLLAVPALAGVLAAALAALTTAALGAARLAAVPAAGVGLGLAALRRLTQVADFHGANVALPAAALPAVVAVAGLGLVALAALRAAGADRLLLRRTVLLAPTVALAALAMPGAARRPPPSGAALRLVAFDVGQGDALLLETPAPETVMVDTGGAPGSSFDPGAAILAPALRARGVAALDAVMISHFHADHAGGLAGLLREIAVGAIWTAPEPPPHPALDGSVTVAALEAGQQRRSGPCAWRVLHPPGTAARTGPGGANDASLVVLLTCGRRSVLLTGDAEAASESRWARGALAAGGVLKVPHHGSRTSSTAPLLAAVAARHVLVSVGWKNRFGLPNDDVLAAYRGRAIAVYRTDRDGAVTFELGRRIRVHGERWTAGRGRLVVGGWLH